MKERRTMEGQGVGRSPVKQYVQPPSFDRIFKKHGMYDGKLFTAANRVTYTFVAEKEAVSIHFDSQRKTIFYKGHNIANMPLDSAQLQHIGQFRHALEKDRNGHPFIQEFDASLQEVLSRGAKE